MCRAAGNKGEKLVMSKRYGLPVDHLIQSFFLDHDITIDKAGFLFKPLAIQKDVLMLVAQNAFRDIF